MVTMILRRRLRADVGTPTHQPTTEEKELLFQMQFTPTWYLSFSLQGVICNFTYKKSSRLYTMPKIKLTLI